MLDIPNGLVILAKRNCVFCERIEMYLNEKNVSYKKIFCDPYIVPKLKGQFIQFISKLANKQWSTFPVGFIDGIFIGGCDDVYKWECQQRITF